MIDGTALNFWFIYEHSKMEKVSFESDIIWFLAVEK